MSRIVFLVSRNKSFIEIGIFGRVLTLEPNALITRTMPLVRSRKFLRKSKRIFFRKTLIVPNITVRKSGGWKIFNGTELIFS